MSINQQLLDEFKQFDPKNIKNHIFQDLDFEGYCRVYNGDIKPDWNLINSNQLHLQIDTITPAQIDIITPDIIRIKRKYVKNKNKLQLT